MYRQHSAGVITNSSTPVSRPIEALGWSGCSFTTDTLTNGSLEISKSGTVSGKGSVVTVNLGVSCRYGTGTGTTLGTATGTTDTSKHAEIDINAKEPKQFLCPGYHRWKATYIVTSPTGLNAK